jgi:hypothetical protein
LLKKLITPNGIYYFSHISTFIRVETLIQQRFDYFFKLGIKISHDIFNSNLQTLPLPLEN